MIETRNVRKEFDGLVALDGVSVTMNEGEITGLIGPNGAGKTVLFNVITGVYPPTDGRVYYQSKDITAMKTWRRSTLGIARGFQQLRLFPEQSARENLQLAAQPKTVRANLKSVISAHHDEQHEQKAEKILDNLELTEKADHKAGELSYGQQKLVQFGSLLMQDPSVIMLDEIMAGVNPTLSDRLKEYIVEYNEKGVTFVVIEHDVPSIMDLCDRVLVLNSGRKIDSGSPSSIQNNPEVIDAYLG